MTALGHGTTPSGGVRPALAGCDTATASISPGRGTRSPHPQPSDPQRNSQCGRSERCGQYRSRAVTRGLLGRGTSGSLENSPPSPGLQRGPHWRSRLRRRRHRSDSLVLSACGRCSTAGRACIDGRWIPTGQHRSAPPPREDQPAGPLWEPLSVLNLVSRAVHPVAPAVAAGAWAAQATLALEDRAPTAAAPVLALISRLPLLFHE